jgi:trans-aconitate methyltransferase
MTPMTPGAGAGAGAGAGGSPQERARHFEDLHREHADPWGFRSSWYERRKYAITVASLPRAHYRLAWEPGCSIGELTVLLAGRADRVDASDVSQTAVAAARRSTALCPGVQVRQAALPSGPPRTGYDLVVLSEVLYYLPAEERAAAMVEVDDAAAPGADLVVVHWRHHPADAWHSGAAVNQEIRSRPGWRRLARHDEPDFVLDVLTRA